MESLFFLTDALKLAVAMLM